MHFNQSLCSAFAGNSFFDCNIESISIKNVIHGIALVKNGRERMKIITEMRRMRTRWVSKSFGSVLSIKSK